MKRKNGDTTGNSRLPTKLERFSKVRICSSIWYSILPFFYFLFIFSNNFFLNSNFFQHMFFKHLIDTNTAKNWMRVGESLKKLKAFRVRQIHLISLSTSFNRMFDYASLEENGPTKLKCLDLSLVAGGLIRDSYTSKADFCILFVLSFYNKFFISTIRQKESAHQI